LRCKTSIGKATVDILLPNIDIDEPAMRIRNAGELEARMRTVRDLAINAVARRVCKTGKLVVPRSSRARQPSGATVFAPSSAVVSRIRAKIPLASLGKPKPPANDALCAAATLPRINLLQSARVVRFDA
jgi:hypothetical protein